MIGMIITGHGSYAPGMTGAMEMIAGEQEKVLTIPFLQGMSLEDYQKEIANGIETLTQEGLEIIIFTDLLGGTPYKTAVTSAYDQAGVEVVSGTNLPMLIESSMLRLGLTAANELVNALLSTGKDGIQQFKIEVSSNDEEMDDFEDGI
ncbi:MULTISPECIES: PTS sugar transporter subunit IIA [Enterococcus]|uniref:PTS sugar transporter subunit IIA n=1 Tax=Enterococcus TaxID=1350 RepID=UPI000A198FB7|nr:MULTISPECIES: PTS sugar transporter subunit IIA [Enterococcus]EGO2668695.1 PTS sugar transporter subunit IIA [Enterococcus faecalis]EGO8854033.1 PTS sugar transporter subunit IIA [Enterococcus faecalis]EHU9666408.1 PTS sugar transporter subunit IIA [Enterococcus faecalis]EIA6622688.1 PTS sugar transporter subunit IIA [Enterococcus faecalis]EIA6786919.1 PTS sugar transporter subunit IIA [Enterococcus faecalis]